MPPGLLVLDDFPRAVGAASRNRPFPTIGSRKGPEDAGVHGIHEDDRESRGEEGKRR